MPSNCPKHSLGANDKHPLVVSIVTEPVIKIVFTLIKKQFPQMVLRAALLVLLVISTTGSDAHIKGDLGKVIAYQDHYVELIMADDGIYHYLGMAFPCCRPDQAGPRLGSNERTPSDHWIKVAAG